LRVCVEIECAIVCHPRVQHVDQVGFGAWGKLTLELEEVQLGVRSGVHDTDQELSLLL